MKQHPPGRLPGREFDQSPPAAGLGRANRRSALGKAAKPALPAVAADEGQASSGEDDVKLKAMLMSIAIATGVAGPAGASPVVPAEAGALRGETLSTGGLVFRGIPYAAPPVGPLRWRAPQPVEAWDGVRDASRFGPSCPQNPFPGDANTLPSTFAEDCLYLNIWTPPGLVATDGARLPVLLSIHGGGLVNGGAAGPVFDGAALARRGIIVVTINYRLGRLGFFGHPTLQAAGGDGASINFGFLDQIAALRWVNRNIGAFGGDPARVTIAGESAGGASVFMLMASPLARGLFAAAIAQSAPSRLDFPPAEAALSAGKAFAVRAGVEANDPDALRAIPLERVLDGVTFFNQDRKVYSGPVIDGSLIPTTIMAAFASGCQANVPLLLGTTGLELGALPGMYATAGFGQLPPAHQEAILAVYDPNGRRKRSDVATEVLSDITFAEPTRATARLAAAAGQPVWLYRFDYVASRDRASQNGAHHASDVAYTFDTVGLVDPKAAPEDLQMARLVADYWANFVQSHNPNAPSLSDWKLFGEGGEPLLTFGPSGAVVQSDPHKPRLDVLERLAAPVAKAACAVAE